MFINQFRALVTPTIELQPPQGVASLTCPMSYMVSIKPLTTSNPLPSNPFPGSLALVQARIRLPQDWPTSGVLTWRKFKCAER